MLLRAAVATAVLLFGSAPGARAQPAPGMQPGPPVPVPDSGFSVLVPYRSGYVNVPLSPSTWPLVPDSGAPGAAAPPAPPSPAAPPSPPTPPDAGGTGFLRIEIEAPSTGLVIDGRDMGPVAALANSGQVVALPPGRHRIELVRPGVDPMTTSVVIRPGQTSVLRLPVDAGPAISADGGSGDGYQVIPPRATSPQPPPVGSGFFVVPKP